MRSLYAHALVVAILVATINHCHAQSESVQIRWLGVAGFSIVAGATTLVFDPYFSRYSKGKLAATRYCPDAPRLASLLKSDPAPELARAQAILIGHSHFDHLGDAAWIAAWTGAAVFGSQTTVLIATAYAPDVSGCPHPPKHAKPFLIERFDPDSGEKLIGDLSVRAIESCHGPVLPIFGVLFEGEYREPGDLPQKVPFRAHRFRLGDVRAYRVVHRPTGITILITGSGCLKDVARQRIDVMLAAAPERRPDEYIQRIVDLKPAFVVPHHYEDFFDENGADARHPNRLEHFKEQIERGGITVQQASPFDPLCVARNGEQTRLAPCPGSQNAP